MSPKHAELSVRALIEVAMPVIRDLPSAQRADCYDGVWIACRECAPDLAKAAKDAAQAIREADHRQLHFSNLLAGDITGQLFAMGPKMTRAERRAAKAARLTINA